MPMPVAWTEGYNAAIEGKSAVHDCPYDVDAQEHMVWLNGYEAWLDEQDELSDGD